MACLAVAGASVGAPLAGATGPDQAGRQQTLTTESTLPGGEKLPRTALEAEERDNGHTSQAPYLIWSGVASVVVVGGGGLFLKRRQDRETKAESTRT